MIVFVAMLGNGTFFWVDKYHEAVCTSFRMDQSVARHSLGDVIHIIADREVMPIDIDRYNFRSLSVSRADYAFYEDFTKKVSEEIGIELRIQQALKKAVVQYEVRNGMAK